MRPGTLLRTACAVVMAATLGAVAARAATPPADLVLYDGIIVTVDPHQPKAQALAIAGERIIAVGTNADIKAYIGAHTQALDLDGRLVIPGFIDSHAHFMRAGLSLMQLDLRATRAPTWKAVVDKVAAAVQQAQPGEWIIGYGWHQEDWTHPPQTNVEGLPAGQALDKVSPDNPVLLRHASGHAIFVNKKALELAGIGRDTPNPPGGEIVRDEHGRAIGMLRDAAMAPVYAALKQARSKLSPAEKRKRLLKQVRLATRHSLKNGVTTWQDMGESFKTIDFLKRLAQEGKLNLRLYVWINDEPLDALKAHLKDYYLINYGRDGLLTVRGIGEVTADGALGTHSAWFYKPYDDLPSSHGINVMPMKTIAGIAEVAINNGFQLSVHAIGARANHEVLNLYQNVMTLHPDRTDLRWRIDHAQHLLPSDIPRFHELHVIAAMQTGHACDDGPYVVERIGEVRAAYSYAWHSLIANRTIIANGTDAPVIPLDPMRNYFCAVTRKENFDPDAKAFYPFQSMTRMEALRSYTANGAYAMFMESELGTLSPGKLADIVVVDKNILTEPAADILKTHVVYTILNGRIMYHRGEGFPDLSQ